MNDLKHFSDRLRQGLKESLLRPEVSATRGNLFKILAFVVSPTFEGMDEAERQAIVWGNVFDTFTEDEQRRIEFIYTDAPSELESQVEPGSASALQSN